jgi:hypothetical protein
MIRAQSLFIIVLCTLLFTGCTSKVEWNQKLTVTVEIDGQEYVGSSVSRMRYTSASKTAFGSRGVSLSEHIKGEAVVVDLGPHGYLFALWPYQKPGKYALSGKPNKGASSDYKTQQKNNFPRLRRISHSTSYKVLEPGKCLANNNIKSGSLKFKRETGDYPVLVAFKSLNFPATITGFNHCEGNWKSGVFNAEKFSQFYGQTARIKSIDFQVTKEPVTEGNLSKVLDTAFFQKWYKRTESLGRGGACSLKTNNPYFCNLHKGKWMRKFPKEKS